MPASRAGPAPPSRAPQLWGGGLDALFPTRRGGPAPMAVTPWPARSGQRGRARLDRAAVAAVLERPPVLVELDPRDLTCSQPHVIHDGVAFYLTDTYRTTGETWADRTRLDNQLPLVQRRADGRLVILGGHHRAAAALLGATAVRALVVDETGAHPPDGPAAVTASLALDPSGEQPGGVAPVLIDRVAATIRAGGSATVGDPATACAVLHHLGAPEVAARRRVRRALHGGVAWWGP